MTATAFPSSVSPSLLLENERNRAQNGADSQLRANFFFSINNLKIARARVGLNRTVRKKISSANTTSGCIYSVTFRPNEIGSSKLSLNPTLSVPQVGTHVLESPPRRSKFLNSLRYNEGLLYINIASYADSRNWSSDLAFCLATVGYKRLMISNKNQQCVQNRCPATGTRYQMILTLPAANLP